MLRFVKRILRGEGFRHAHGKGGIFGGGTRQHVTGVTVNRKPSPPREEVRRLRALLHDARLNGPATANRNGVPNFGAHVRGRIEAVRALDRGKGERLLEAWRRVTWAS